MSEPLQFDRVEPVAADSPTAVPLACHGCGAALHHAYWQINGRLACERCRMGAETAFAQRPGPGGVLRALAAGFAAAVVGSLVWYGVRAATDAEWGLVAIGVGLLVGFAVRWGSRGRGGALFQAIAIVLTYFSIVSTYVPLILEGLREGDDGRPAAAAKASEAAPGPALPVEAESADVETKAAPELGPTSTTAAPIASDASEPPAAPSLGVALAGIALLLALAAAAPFLAGVDNLLGLAIIGIALYEAWKINRRPKLEILGPFSATAGAPSAA